MGITRRLFMPLVAVMVICCHDCGAQGFLFKVMAVHGRVEVKGLDGAVTPAKVGFSLREGMTLITSENSYVALLYKTGNVMEVKGRANHLVRDLVEKLPQAKTGVTTRLVNYAISRINEVNEDPETNYKENLRAAAGVERALNGEIKVLLKYQDKSNIFYENQVMIEWLPEEKADSYEVVITDVFSEELYKTTTTNSFQIIDLEQAGITDIRMFLVKVISNTGISSRLFRLERSDDDSINEQMLVDHTGKSAGEEVMLALFFEERGLYVDALKHYQQAAQISPDVNIYSVLKDHFITTQELGN